MVMKEVLKASSALLGNISPEIEATLVISVYRKDRTKTTVQQWVDTDTVKGRMRQVSGSSLQESGGAQRQTSGVEFVMDPDSPRFPQSGNRLRMDGKIYDVVGTDGGRGLQLSVTVTLREI